MTHLCTYHFCKRNICTTMDLLECDFSCLMFAVLALKIKLKRKKHTCDWSLQWSWTNCDEPDLTKFLHIHIRDADLPSVHFIRETEEGAMSSFRTERIITGRFVWVIIWIIKLQVKLFCSRHQIAPLEPFSTGLLSWLTKHSVDSLI